jgi:hypothetical protein
LTAPVYDFFTAIKFILPPFYTAERENNMKKQKLTALLLCLTMIFATACSQLSAEIPTESQTTTADTQEENVPVEKFVGSRLLREFITTTFVYETIEDMTRRTYDISGRIVIGRVESAEVRRFYWGEPDREYPPQRYDNVTDYTIVVSDTLFGEESDTLVLATMGLPDSDVGFTKPSIGDTLLLFAWYAEDCGVFGLMQWEEAMFRIEDDGTLYSFSDAEYTARFDGLPLETLTSEINAGLEVAAREGNLLLNDERTRWMFEETE